MRENRDHNMKTVFIVVNLFKNQMIVLNVFSTNQKAQDYLTVISSKSSSKSTFILEKEVDPLYWAKSLLD